ncbi:hypothetical protein PMIN06_013114 [Paraphaeosphaeria minitans]
MAPKGMRPYKNEELDYVPKYYLDHRNPTHQFCMWTHCEEPTCAQHKAEKEENKRQPEKTLRCRYHWTDCPIEACDEHLWDKRQVKWFPHLTPKGNECCNILVNGDCMQPCWYTCLNQDCEYHYMAKRLDGFANCPTQEATTELLIQPVHRNGEDRGRKNSRTSSREEEDDLHKPRTREQRQKRMLRNAYQAPELDYDLHEQMSFLGLNSDEKTPLSN